MTIIILDQFIGPTPYSLQRNPILWEAFIQDVVLGDYDVKHWRKAKIVELSDNVVLDMATTAYHEVDGRVAVWRARWDTSG